MLYIFYINNLLYLYLACLFPTSKCACLCVFVSIGMCSVLFLYLRNYVLFMYIFVMFYSCMCCGVASGLACFSPLWYEMWCIHALHILYQELCLFISSTRLCMSMCICVYTCLLWSTMCFTMFSSMYSILVLYKSIMFYSCTCLNVASGLVCFSPLWFKTWYIHALNIL